MIENCFLVSSGLKSLVFLKRQRNFCAMANPLASKFSLKSKITNPGKSDPPPDHGTLSGMTLSQNCSVDEPPTVTQAREELEMSVDFKRIGKEIEDYVRSRRMSFEEKMFEKFYIMRIEQSRKFIDLIRKINKSWDDFVEYLKAIGAQGASGDGDCTIYSITNSSSLTGLSQVTNDSK